MADVFYHGNLNEAQADARLLALLGRDQQSSPFNRLDWLADLHRQCLASFEPLLIEGRNRSGATFLPLMRPERGMLRRGQWQALANWYSFSAGPVFSGDGGNPARLDQLGAIARALPARASRISLAPVADDRGEASLLCDAFASAGWMVFRTACDRNHVTALDGSSFDDWWQRRPGKLRATVRRKGRKSQVAISISAQFSDADWAQYERVYAKSWKPSEGSPAFLRRFAEREAQAGNLRLGIALYDGKPVAAQFWTVDHGTAYIHKLAHDPAAQEHSPGTLLSAAMFQHAIDIDRVQLIDFGTGDDGYKRDWMDRIRQRYRIELFWPHNPASWPFIARNWLRSRA